MSVKLLFLLGMAAASAEDLLLASRLQLEYKVDLSLYLSSICSQSSYSGPVSYNYDPTQAKGEKIFELNEGSTNELEEDKNNQLDQASQAFRIIDRSTVQDEMYIY